MTNQPRDLKSRNVAANNIHHIYQQIIDKAPTDETVEKTGPEAEAKNRFENADPEGHTDQAFDRQTPIRFTGTGGDDAGKPAHGIINRHQGGNDKDSEENLFKCSEHSVRIIREKRRPDNLKKVMR